MTSPLVSLSDRKHLFTSIPSKFNNLHSDPASHPLEASDKRASLGWILKYLRQRVVIREGWEWWSKDENDWASCRLRDLTGAVWFDTRRVYGCFETCIVGVGRVGEVEGTIWRSRSFAGNFPRSNHSLSNSNIAWTNQENLYKIIRAVLPSNSAQIVETRPSNSSFPRALSFTILHGLNWWRRTLVSTLGYS